MGVVELRGEKNENTDPKLSYICAGFSGQLNCSGGFLLLMHGEGKW